jgi:4-hydroxy-tetrahydrodipicolinate reductase
MINIVLSGCNGKMGHAISRLVSKDDLVNITCGIDINTDAHFLYPVISSPSEFTLNADVIIDFSNSAALEGILNLAKSKKIPVVICTTGLSSSQVETIKETSKEVAVFYSANMSIGVNLIIDLVKKATKALNGEFDIEIIEKHHNQKLDAPSGTALAIADAISDTLNGECQYVYDRHSSRKKRTSTEIGIHAIRGGNIIGEHEILFCGSDEVISIGHSAASREVFAVGAIRAAKYVSSLSPGLYNMSSMLNSL